MARRRTSKLREPLEWFLAVFGVLAVCAWVIGAYGVGGLMFAEHTMQRDDPTCVQDRPAAPGDDSSSEYHYGTSTWQWWPPGKVCHYRDGTATYPSDTRSIAIIVLGVTGVVGLAIGMVLDRRRGPWRPPIPA